MNKNVGISYKAFAVILAAVLVLGGTIGGTMAWLIDKDVPVTNTFTDSDIEINLEETKKDFKMIPGHTIDKDPKVTVEAGSEACYLFVKIEESENYSKYLEYAIDKEWKPVTDEDGDSIAGVYYTTVEKDAEKREFSILTGGSIGEADKGDGVFTWEDNQVLVKPSVTKSDMDAIDGKNANGTDNTEEIKNRPTLTFTAYAVQLYKTNGQKFDVAIAWEKAKANEQNATNN